MLKKIIAIGFVIYSSGKIMSQVIPCYTYSNLDYWTVEPVPTTECAHQTKIVNCDASQSGYETLYYNIWAVSPKLYRNTGLYSLGSVQGTDPQTVSLPNTAGPKKIYLAEFSNVDLGPHDSGWLTSAESFPTGLVLPSSATLYVSTKTLDSNGLIYTSTTSCPTSSQSGQSDAIASKSGSSAKQLKQAKAMVSKARMAKR